MMNPHSLSLQFLHCLLLFLSIYPHFSIPAFPSPNDPSALLDFKSHADLQNRLRFSSHTSFNFCSWNGVRCSGTRTVRVVIENVDLGGVWAPNTLTRLDQLRVLSLQNNSLTGRIPDLSGLPNLKALFLSRNCFSGSVPPSVSALHRLKTLDLSYNMLSGPVPEPLSLMDRLYCLRLEFNRFTGSVPAFNQSSLQIFNVSHNLLSGAIPVTLTISRFETSSFGLNSGLCGEIVHKECHSILTFFPQTPAVAAPPTPVQSLSQTADQLQSGVALGERESLVRKHRKAALLVGLSSGVSFFVLSLVFFALAAGRCRRRPSGGEITKMGMDLSVTGNAEAVMRIEAENDELEEKVKRVQEGKQMMEQSGSLVFCAGEPQAYTQDHLMRSSAELLGRGTMGTTYKAALDSRRIITVKRLDAGLFTGVSQEAFARHMESVGGLRHPNLVPLRAYLQAREERLLIYDFNRNGSLFALIHGSKSARAKPLHWTSCLKIAEDVAQGLSYIHQAWRLVHGNLKSPNVLLGSDFEACLTDYCLTTLATGAAEEENANSAAYLAPEIRKSGNRREADPKCDVYSFGVLLFELLTGKHPCEHPDLGADETTKWMRSVREEESGQNRSEMLLGVGMACCAAAPAERPTMWRVLKMIQEIKEVVLMEDIQLQRNLGTF